MKTVIVFDTDDREGMENTVTIVDHLSKQYLGKRSMKHDRSFGKIRFIKLLRSFANEAKADLDRDAETHFGALSYTKKFADKVWNDEI
jgi:hypothetical protein